MPRKNNNAIGKAQGVKRKAHTPEVVERKAVRMDFTIGSRISDETRQALKEVFSK